MDKNKKTESFKSLLKKSKSKFAKTSIKDVRKAGKEAGEALNKLPLIKFICTVCGSDDIRRNADTKWNVKKQKWEVVSLFDNFTCEQCGGECNVDEVKA